MVFNFFKLFEKEQKPIKIKIIGARLGETALVDVFQHIEPEARVGIANTKGDISLLTKIIELKEKIKNNEKLTKKEKELYNKMSAIPSQRDYFYETGKKLEKVRLEDLDEASQQFFLATKNMFLRDKKEFEQTQEASMFFEEIVKHVKKVKKGKIVPLLSEKIDQMWSKNRNVIVDEVAESASKEIEEMKKELEEKVEKGEINRQEYLERLIQGRWNIIKKKGDIGEKKLEERTGSFIAGMTWKNVLKNKVNIAIVDWKLLEYIKEEVRKTNPEMLEKGMVEFKTL